MDALIVWILIINPYGVYCNKSIEITFPNKQECVRALKTVDFKNANLSCIPREAMKL
jgi:hypothetical protein